MQLNQPIVVSDPNHIMPPFALTEEGVKAMYPTATKSDLKVVQTIYVPPSKSPLGLPLFCVATGVGVYICTVDGSTINVSSVAYLQGRTTAMILNRDSGRLWVSTASNIFSIDLIRPAFGQRQLGVKEVIHMHYSAKYHVVLAVTTTGFIHVWDAVSSAILMKYRINSKSITSVATVFSFATKKTAAVSMDTDMTCFMYSIGSFDCQDASFLQRRSYLEVATYVVDCGRRVVSFEINGTPSVEAPVIQRDIYSAGTDQEITAICASKRRGLLFVGLAGGNVVVIEAKTGSVVKTIGAFTDIPSVSATYSSPVTDKRISRSIITKLRSTGSPGTVASNQQRLLASSPHGRNTRKSNELETRTVKVPSLNAPQTFYTAKDRRGVERTYRLGRLTSVSSLMLSNDDSILWAAAKENSSIRSFGLLFEGDKVVARKQTTTACCNGLDAGGSSSGKDKKLTVKEFIAVSSTRPISLAGFMGDDDQWILATGLNGIIAFCANDVESAKEFGYQGHGACNKLAIDHNCEVSEQENVISPTAASTIAPFIAITEANEREQGKQIGFNEGANGMLDANRKEVDGISPGIPPLSNTQITTKPSPSNQQQQPIPTQTTTTTSANGGASQWNVADVVVGMAKASGLFTRTPTVEQRWDNGTSTGRQFTPPTEPKTSPNMPKETGKEGDNEEKSGSQNSSTPTSENTNTSSNNSEGGEDHNEQKRKQEGTILLSPPVLFRSLAAEFPVIRRGIAGAVRNLREVISSALSDISLGAKGGKGDRESFAADIAVTKACNAAAGIADEADSKLLGDVPQRDCVEILRFSVDECVASLIKLPGTPSITTRANAEKLVGALHALDNQLLQQSPVRPKSASPAPSANGRSRTPATEPDVGEVGDTLTLLKEVKNLQRDILALKKESKLAAKNNYLQSVEIENMKQERSELVESNRQIMEENRALRVKVEKILKAVDSSEGSAKEETTVERHNSIPLNVATAQRRLKNEMEKGEKEKDKEIKTICLDILSAKKEGSSEPSSDNNSGDA